MFFFVFVFFIRKKFIIYYDKCQIFGLLHLVFDFKSKPLNKILNSKYNKILLHVFWSIVQYLKNFLEKIKVTFNIFWKSLN